MPNDALTAAALLLIALSLFLMLTAGERKGARVLIYAAQVTALLLLIWLLVPHIHVFR
jgi:hypothetical protein